MARSEDVGSGASATGSAVQSVDRAIAILELLAARGEAGVTEIAEAIGVHKSTASRLVGALHQGHLLEQLGDRGKYTLGFGIAQLESGWWDGVINGVRGWFPSNYCAVVSRPTDDVEDERNGVDLDDDQDAQSLGGTDYTNSDTESLNGNDTILPIERNESSKEELGFRVRAAQEHADELWVLKTTSSYEEARYYEAYYAAKYGLPTLVFHMICSVKDIF